MTDAWAARIVADAHIRPGELVFDIGAGQGAITGHLVEAGAQVVAVEAHPGRAGQLRRRFAGTPVSIVEADVLGLRLPHRPFRVVASPPYAISSALMRLLLAPDSRLASADLVLQRATARRHIEKQILAPRRQRSRGWALEMGRSLPRTAFRPPPQVDSVVLMIRRR